MKLTDVYKLPFDEPSDEQLSNDDIEQMRQQSQMLEDYLNSQPTHSEQS